MRALTTAAIGAEIAVVSTLAVSSFHIAFAGPTPDWLAGAPLLTVVALESLRLPLAFRLPRMRLLGLACGVAMLAGLSVITGEAASSAFENLIFQRTRPVVEAERDLAKAEIDRDALNKPRTDGRRRSPGSKPTSRRRGRIGPSIDKPLELQARPRDGPARAARLVELRRRGAGRGRRANAAAQRPTPTSSGTPARW